MSGKNVEQASVASALLERARLQQYSERTLGARAWGLLSMYGRVMAGPHCGQYVSAMPSAEMREVVDSLAQVISCLSTLCIPIALVTTLPPNCDSTEFSSGWCMTIERSSRNSGRAHIELY